jgi:hypothetical protein
MSIGGDFLQGGSLPIIVAGRALVNPSAAVSRQAYSRLRRLDRRTVVTERDPHNEIPVSALVEAEYFPDGLSMRF